MTPIEAIDQAYPPGNGLEIKTKTTDHAGFTVEVGVWPLSATLNYYDSRHADAR